MRYSIMLALLAAAPFQVPAQEAALPTVDQVLAKYVAASGGNGARKVTSRVMTGTIDVLTFGLSGSFEQYTKAPNRQITVSDLAGFGKVIQCTDGKSGWASDPQQGVREMTPEELSRSRRSADLESGLHLQDQYKKMAVIGKSKVGEREAYLVEAQPAEGGPEKLYFDTQTGLLIQIERPDATGGSITTLDDFRDVNGVKIPFSIYQDTGQAEVQIKIQQVKQNVPIDDARFARPAA